MRDTRCKSLAMRFMQATLRLTPPGYEEWAQAMLAELAHVEGSWAAVSWALQCTSILVLKRMEHVVVRRPLVAVSVACLCAVGVLFLMPGFRQALATSAFPLQMMAGSNTSRSAWPDSALEALAVQAEGNKDAQAYAFLATRLQDASASARAADEAVRLDPSLAWVYYPVALRYPKSSHGRKWAEKLRQYDPQNAGSFLILANILAFEESQARQTEAMSGERGASEHSIVDYKEVLAEGLSAPRFDDYLSDQLELDRDVVMRYGVWDPLVFLSGFPPRDPLPTTAAAHIRASMRSGRFPFLRTHAEGPLARYLEEHENRSPAWSMPPFTSVRVIHVSTFLIPGFALMLGLGIVFRRQVSSIGITGAIGMFCSSTALYLAFSPYGNAFKDFIAAGDAAQLEQLRVFYSLGFLQPVTRGFLISSGWWASVILLSVSLLVHLGMLWRLRVRGRQPS